MIRWRFVLTRLIVIVAILMLMRWGLGPVAQYVTVKGLQSATGAKVEIAKTRIGLFPPRVQYTDVNVADPREDKELRNAFHADTIDLVIDGEALMQRRWVASDGRITGLQVGSRRETSGHISELDLEATESNEPSMLAKLLGATGDKVAEKADAIVDDLEMVRVSKQIQTEWEQEYASLVTRARNLEKQITTIRDTARGIENPLRDWPEFERTLAEAQKARSELISVRQSIDALPQRLQNDMAKLDQAKQVDIAKVDQYVPGDLSNSGEFGIEMLSGAVREQIRRIESYLDGGRTIANYTIVAPESERIRGVNHDLDLIQRPDVMVRRCEVGGVMRADGNVYAVTGIVENLTPTPDVLVEPTRARLRLEGPEILRVEYVRDRRDAKDVDLLTIHWPQTDAKPIRLGDDDDAGISISGGRRELWIQVRTQGDQIQGRLVSKQTGVRMGLSVDPKLADSAAAVSLQESLAAVDKIEIDANFAGTWKDLDLKLSTNLGQILRRASQQAIDQQINRSKQQLAAKIERTHTEQTLALQQWLGKQQTEARSLLASADETIAEMNKKMLDEWGEADAYLGRFRSAIRGRLK